MSYATLATDGHAYLEGLKQELAAAQTATDPDRCHVAEIEAEIDRVEADLRRHEPETSAA